MLLGCEKGENKSKPNEISQSYKQLITKLVLMERKGKCCEVYGHHYGTLTNVSGEDLFLT